MKRRLPVAEQDQSGSGSSSRPTTLLTRLKRIRWPGVAAMLVGLVGLFLLMANDRQVPRGPLLGLTSLAVGFAGFLDMLGLLVRPSTASDNGPQPARLVEVLFAARSLPFGKPEPRWMSPQWTVPTACLVLLCGVFLPLVGIDALSQGVFLPALVVLSLLLLAPSAVTRPGMLVFMLTALIYLPFLGSYGLWDPWETHYGEVAREILARDDWISLWWAQDGWFWSKPILIFWMEALSLASFGVDFHPDANPFQPEWAIRLPIVLISMLAVMATYFAVSSVFRKRTGVLSALCLATAPHFFFLAHQAITDMAFVGCMTVAVCCLLMALKADSSAPLRAARLGKSQFDGRHVVLGVLFLLVVPQAFYLLSRNLSLLTAADLEIETSLPYLFSWHGDQFTSGSGLNPGIPGNADAVATPPQFGTLFAQPFAQGLLWLAGFALLTWLVVRERSSQGLWMVGFYVFCALAFMGKGIPGVALPGLVSLLYLVASGRWSLLLEGRLRIGVGVLTVSLVGLPWYVAMYLRHGPRFTDRLLVHDHLKRLASGVHGDNGSIEYFVEQLGVGTFPWLAMFPAALTYWLWSSQRSEGPATATDPSPSDAAPERRGARRETVLLLSLWFVSAFVLFSGMITKFHHYIFPAVPPAMMLTGIVLDRLWEPQQEWTLRGTVAAVLAFVVPIPLVLGFAGLWGDISGVVPEGVGPDDRMDWVLAHPLSSALSWTLIAVALAGFGGACFLRPGKRGEDRFRTPGMLAGLLLGAVVLVFVARDLSWATGSRPQGYERLIHLFVYNYGRPWPTQFDFRPILTGFAIAAGGLFGLIAWPRVGPVAARSVVALALLFSVWCLDVYIPRLSPHWGQRELVKKYYDERSGPDEPLIAWQMNWKGENFYTGNRVHVYVDLDNKKIREWLKDFHGRAFFMMEHGRVGGFRGLVNGKQVQELTDKQFCNKFILLQVDFAGSQGGQNPTPESEQQQQRQRQRRQQQQH